MEWQLELPEDFQQGQRAAINLLGNTFSFIYRPSAKEEETLTDPAAAEAFISNHKRWSSTQVMLQHNVEEVLALLPDLEHKKGSSYITVDVQQVLEALEKSPIFSKKLDPATLYEQEAATLKQQKLEQGQKKQAIESLLYGIAAKDEPLEDLPNNYEGEKKEQVFGENYQTAINNNNAVQSTLEAYRTQYNQEIEQLKAAIDNANIPVELRQQSREARAKRDELEEKLSTVEQEVIVYEQQQLSFEEWKGKLETMNKTIAALQSEWNQTFTFLQTAVTTYEASEQGKKMSRAYQSWKKEDYGYLSKYTNNIEDSVALIQNKVKEQQSIIERTGGDGVLEYKEGENKVDDTEKASFAKNGATLSFKTPDTELYGEKGIEPTDIDQGGIGDCYLLACLATLAQGESKQLIEQAIEDKGNYFEVTLYKGGVSVKIGVDRAMLFKYQDFGDGDIRQGYLAANPTKKLWVAILEKAYAKLESGREEADYSKIELNSILG